jgi:DNA repair exonuclease SbcCD ATPase subunit
MKLQKIHLKNFLCHDARTIDIPESGLIVVSGANGAGKSAAFVEAISYGLWGKTVRKTSPWRADGTPGSVRLEFADGSSVERSGSSKVSPTLKVSLPGDAVAGTTGKTQDGLEKVFGDYASWRRTAVFSATDVLRFTEASDGERKRALESMLGLEVFDVTLQLARDRKVEVQRQLQQKQGALSIAKVELEHTRIRRKEALAATQETLGEVPEAPADPFDLRTELSVAENELARASVPVRRAAPSAATVDRVTYEVRRRDLQTKIEKLRAARACPVCEQTIPVELVQRLAIELAQQKMPEPEPEPEPEPQDTSARDALVAKVAQLRMQRAMATQTWAAYQAALTAHKERAARITQAEERVAQLAQSEQTLASRVGEYIEDIDILEEKLGELAVAESVFGLKGVRAMVLSEALSGLEQVATAYLRALTKRDVSLRIASAKENKDGSTSDVIAIDVVGVGTGPGNLASLSRGERQRVDVAVLLALAEVSHGLSGRVPGLLIVDEAFDSLDLEGIGALEEVLTEMARARPVALITHMPTPPRGDVQVHLSSAEARG